MKGSEILEEFEAYRQKSIQYQKEGLNDIKAEDVRASFLSVLNKQK